MVRHRRLLLAIAASAVCASLAPVSAQGAVTRGPALDLAPNRPGGCQNMLLVPAPLPSCTWWGVTDPNAGWSTQTPRGQWVITRARVRTGPDVGPMTFTVLRALRSQATPPGGLPGGAACCQIPVESQVFVPQPNSVNTIAVRLPVVNTVQSIDGEPVEVVDYLAITNIDSTSSAPVHFAQPGQRGSGAAAIGFTPAMRQGQQGRTLGPSLSGATPLVNGDFEPDADGDGLGDETQETGAGGGAPGGGTPGGGAPGTPGVPGTGAPDARAPVRLGRLGRVRRGRLTALVMRCRLDRSCRGRVRLQNRRARGAVASKRRRTVTYSSRAFRAAAGKRKRVGLRLNRRGRRLVRRRRNPHVWVNVTIGRGDSKKVVSRRIRLRG